MWHIRQAIGNETRIVSFKTQAEVIAWLQKHLPEKPNVAYAVHLRYAIPPTPPQGKKPEKP